MNRALHLERYRARSVFRIRTDVASSANVLFRLLSLNFKAAAHVLSARHGNSRIFDYFPFGGLHLTKDIAHGLRVSIPEATNIKHSYGCVAGFLMSEDERQSVIEITPVGRTEKRQLSKEILCDIMQPRAVELLQHVAHEVFANRGQILSGVVLTGGGALSRGMVEIAEQVFDAPTRLGFLEAKHFGGLLDEVQSPEWSVAGGLALASMRSQIREHSSGGKSPTRKVAEWFENFRGKFR